MPVLVTGATGLVGNNVARLLLEQGHAVRVLVREQADPRPLSGLDVEVLNGDVRDPQAVERACQGVQAVLHAAGLIHIGWSRLDLARDINVGGTRNVAEAAREAGVRLVHVSTVDALALGSRDGPADEDTVPNGSVPCTYVQTKSEADAVVRELGEDGLDAVIVHPCFMLGPWDWKPSSGRMLLAVGKQFTPVAPTGGFNLCDIRDVSQGILSAWQQGRSGRNYILGGHNMRYLDGWRLFAEVAGGHGPLCCAGPLMRILGGRAGDVWGKLSGREPDLNSAAVAMSSQYHYYSSRRAETELGYRCRPPRESVEAAWQWFREHGYA